jgi:hypothetical protein
MDSVGGKVTPQSSFFRQKWEHAATKKGNASKYADSFYRISPHPHTFPHEGIFYLSSDLGLGLTITKLNLCKKFLTITHPSNKSSR